MSLTPPSQGVVLDARHLPLPDESIQQVEVILPSGSLLNGLISDNPVVVSELARVMVPGANAEIITDTPPSSQREGLPISRVYSHRAIVNNFRGHQDIHDQGSVFSGVTAYEPDKEYLQRLSSPTANEITQKSPNTKIYRVKAKKRK